MAISVGDKIPDTKLTFMADDGPAQKSTDEIFGGKTVVLFAVPGAFTPTCSNNHLPGYVTHADALREKGVDEIAVVSVNDPFVMAQWSKVSGGDSGILFFADGSAIFTRALGMDIDLSVAGLGTRSKRYAMVVQDGTVKTLNIEDNPGHATASTAEAILKTL